MELYCEKNCSSCLKPVNPFLSISLFTFIESMSRICCSNKWREPMWWLFRVFAHNGWQCSRNTIWCLINHLDKCRGYCIHWPYSRWYRLGLSSHDCITNIIILIILKVKVNVHVTREVELSLLDHAAFNVEKPLNVIIWFILCYLPPLTIYLS